MDQANCLSVIRRDNILRLLKYYNLSRNELATALSVHRNYVNKLLSPNKPSSIGTRTRTKIEDFFKLEPCSLDKDLSKRFPIMDAKPILGLVKEQSNLNAIAEQNFYKNIERKVLSVPLYSSIIDTGDLDHSYEKNLQQGYLDIQYALINGIQPNSVKAYKISSAHYFPIGSILYIDTSTNKAKMEHDQWFLVGHNGYRKVLKLNSSNTPTDMVIYGRIFHVEYSV